MKIKIEVDIHPDLTPLGIEDRLRVVAEIIGQQQYVLLAGKVEIRGKQVATWETVESKNKATIKTKDFYVEGSGWFVTRVKNKREAHKEGILEYGRGRVSIVREATRDEVKVFVAQKGEQALQPSAS